LIGFPTLLVLFDGHQSVLVVVDGSSQEGGVYSLTPRVRVTTPAVWKLARRWRVLANTSRSRYNTRSTEARKKVARLVLSFVVVFVVCWLPRHVWYFWFNFDPNEYNLFWHVFKITAFCLSYINSCVNPLALYFLSRQFRRYYDRYLFCGCRRQLQAGDQRGPALLATSAQRSQRAAPVDSMATSRSPWRRHGLTSACG